MYRTRPPSDIVQQWQDDVEQNTEAGVAPMLELGVSNMAAHDLPALLAMQRWCAQRSDITRPYLPVGGLGPLWIAAMMRPVSRHAAPDVPEPMVLYSGTNDAEYILTVAMAQAAADRTRPNSHRRDAIPVSWLVPQSQPAMALSWDALPFLYLNPRPRVPHAGAAVGEMTSVSSAPADPTQDWLAWAGLLLALFLVLLAVLV